jgi:hypothetical protein
VIDYGALRGALLGARRGALRGARRFVTLVAAAFPDELDFAAGFLGEILFSATCQSPPLVVPAPRGALVGRL